MTTIYCDRSMLPERREWDYYPTPVETVRSILSRLEMNPGMVLDPGPGSGVWGGEIIRRWPQAILYGAEAQALTPHPAYSQWTTVDFLDYRPEVEFDLVVGNPPYAQAEMFVRKSLKLCRADGVVVFLLRLAFLEGQKRRDGLFSEFPPCEVSVCSKRPSFTGDGRTNATAFCACYWRKGWSGTTSLTWLR